MSSLKPLHIFKCIHMDFSPLEGITRAATDCTRKSMVNLPEAKPSML